MRLSAPFFFSFLQLFVDCLESLEHFGIVILVATHLLNHAVLGVGHNASGPIQVLDGFFAILNLREAAVVHEDVRLVNEWIDLTVIRLRAGLRRDRLEVVVL